MRTKQQVTVLGAGAVGTALARALARSGRDVVIGVRHPEAPEVQHLVDELAGEHRAVQLREAIADSDVIIAAIPGVAMVELIDECADVLAGKTFIDATNNLSHGHASGRLSSLPYLVERVPAAHGFRAFNSVGWENMADPHFDGEQADLFYAGQDGPERASVEQLIADVGFRPQYVGAGPDALTAVD
jgi:predicted dinucleotide-binding enzyme